ncbi:MAG: hypothetical protein R2860_04355 [Desulfobacterales bacterium]
MAGDDGSGVFSMIESICSAAGRLNCPEFFPGNIDAIVKNFLWWRITTVSKEFERFCESVNDF